MTRDLAVSPILRTATLAKTEHVIPSADFMKLRRLMEFAREHGMRAMYFCVSCEQPVRLTPEAPVQLTDGRPAAPQPRLDCACAVWKIR